MWPPQKQRALIWSLDHLLVAESTYPLQGLGRPTWRLSVRHEHQCWLVGLQALHELTKRALCHKHQHWFIFVVCIQALHELTEHCVTNTSAGLYSGGPWVNKECIESWTPTLVCRSSDPAWRCTSGGVYVPVFTHMPRESYCRWLRSLLLYLCYIFWVLINSLVCWSCMS